MPMAACRAAAAWAGWICKKGRTRAARSGASGVRQQAVAALIQRRAADAPYPREGSPMTAIVRLSLPRDRFALEAHFAALSTEDLCNRFCHSIKPETVTKYLDQWSAAGIPSYGIFDPDRALVAVSQLARSADELEVGLSVLPTYRRKGLALALLYRSARYARTRGLKALIIHCLRRPNTRQRLPTSPRAPGCTAIFRLCRECGKCLTALRSCKSRTVSEHNSARRTA